MRGIRIMIEEKRCIHFIKMLWTPTSAITVELSLYWKDLRYIIGTTVSHTVPPLPTSSKMWFFGGENWSDTSLCVWFLFQWKVPNRIDNRGVLVFHFWRHFSPVVSFYKLFYMNNCLWVFYPFLRFGWTYLDKSVLRLWGIPRWTDKVIP